MKLKKLTATLLLAAMIAAWAVLPASAADIYFTSINNILMPLSDDTMPISYNGTIYIPYSVFNSLELGTYAVYSSSAQAVTLLGTGTQLIYDLKNGNSYNAEGTTYEYAAVYTNGRIYIPAAFTSSYFGITYSTISNNEYGVIVRFKIGDVYDDATFSTAASYLMRSRLNDYLIATGGAQPGGNNGSPGTSTQNPGPDPDHSDVEVYLSFFGLDDAVTPRLLSLLSRYDYSACFFLSAEDIAGSPDLVRRICGQGYTVGLICSEDVSADYADAAELLFEAAHTSAFLVAVEPSALAEESVTALADAVADSGLVFYCDAGAAEEFSVAECERRLSEPAGRVDLMFTTEEETAEGLSSVLNILRSGKFNVLRLTEARAAALGGSENE